MAHLDYILVGGGLQNALLALALVARNPGTRTVLIERAARLGGNHTWCFHSGDLPADAAAFVEPLIVQRWPGYAVRFPRLERYVDQPYAAITSERLHDVLTALARRHPALELRFGEVVKEVRPGSVELASGEVLEARTVVDARGPAHFESDQTAGFQKFLGQELEVEKTPQLAVPTLMDARVPQHDGFRFFYVLPLAPGRVLIEDTYFSDSAQIDRPALRLEISAHAATLGLRATQVIREEVGVLPLPTRPWPAPAPVEGLVQGGYQGGWFHPTTGYSFPLAVRFARTVAGAPAGELIARLARLGQERNRQQRFCTLLNRLLFAGFAPEQRIHVFERFYRLPAPAICRFYALSLTHGDRLRLLCGRPPAGFSLARLVNSSRHYPVLSPRKTKHDPSASSS